MKTIRSYWLLSIPIFLATIAAAIASPPVISNISASQRAGTMLVDIYYDLSAQSSPVTIYVAVSANGGLDYSVPVFTLSGAVGPGVAVGTGRHIVWNAGADWGGNFSSQCKLRITADDGTSPPAPAGMAWVPSGSLQMGDSFAEGSLQERPVHSVSLNGFFIDKNLVYGQQWNDVYNWATQHGYSLAIGSNNGLGYPQVYLTWYDSVKWCNARSEREGLTPCYYTDATLTTVYRTGNTNLTNACVKWSANGYRLPTEAEWEYAARGGIASKRFPWGDTINHSNANYYSATNYSYDLGGYNKPDPTWGNNYNPIGFFPANGFGLFDLTGDVAQWCWDSFDSSWYSFPAAEAWKGPPGFTGSHVVRGYNYNSTANYLRTAFRNSNGPTGSTWWLGFRCIKGL